MRVAAAGRTIRAWAEAGLVVLGILFLLGVAAEGADWVWALHLRGKRDQAYVLLSRIHLGMKRSEVRSLLDVPDPPYESWDEGDPQAITVFVRSSLFDGCYASIEFSHERVTRVSTSRASESGPCPGWEEQWGW